MSVLNIPLEVGMRALLLLVEAYPTSLDLNRLVLLDHALVHSADLEGPDSVHPALPLRAGELGIKRRLVEQGIQAMIRVHMVDVELRGGGIEFRASEGSDAFVRMLESRHSRKLSSTAEWVVETFGELPEDDLRQRMSSALGHWAEEFFDESPETLTFGTGPSPW